MDKLTIIAMMRYVTKIAVEFCFKLSIINVFIFVITYCKKTAVLILSHDVLQT